MQFNEVADELDVALHDTQVAWVKERRVDKKDKTPSRMKQVRELGRLKGRP